MTPRALLEGMRPGLDGAEVNVPCGTCNRCCRSGLQVPLRDDERRRLPHVFDTSLARYILAFKDDGKTCSQLDDQGRCSIYDRRPESCRVFDCRVMWLAGVRAHEDSRGAAVNAKLDEWRAECNDDIDRGILVVCYEIGQQAVHATKDVWTGACAGVSVALGMSKADLAKVGKRCAEKAARILRVLNEPEKYSEPAKSNEPETYG